jgi:hypothetical protein
MNVFIRLLYAILIASAVVAFVGVGIYTFYPAPQAPTYPMTPAKGIAQPIGGGDTQQAADDYQQALDQYNTDRATYQRNVSIILAVLTPIVVVAGLWLQKRLDIIGEGLALGGVGLSIYAITAASIADDRIMRFIAVTFFLASVIAVVYFKFSESMHPVPAARKKA